MPLTKRTRRTSAAVWSVATALILAIGPARMAGASGPAAYTVTAGADALRVALVSTSLPLSSEYDVGMPSAQAVIDSLGQSRAYAAAPYPSDTGETLPGLAATLGLAVLPPYPMIIRTEAPTTTDDQITQGPLTLRVHSEDGTSAGHAAVAAGSGAASTSADANVHRDDARGMVTAMATTVTDGLNLSGGQLRVASVHSKAEATIDAAGHVHLSQQLDVTGLAIGGIAIRLTPSGVQVADSAIPLPFAAFNQVLAKSRMSIQYLAPVIAPDHHSIVAAGVSISTVVTGVLQQPLAVTYTFGRAFAQAVGTAATVDVASAPDLGSSTLPPVVAATGVSPPIQEAPTPPAVSVPQPGPPTGGGPQAQLSGLPQALSRRIPIRQFALGSSYLLVILTAIVIVVLGYLFKHVGVRSSWID